VNYSEEAQRFALILEAWESVMKSPFAGLVGAILALASASPAQPKFIGTMYYEPQIMLGMCKDDIARGNAGFCTGYIIGTLDQMQGAREVCLPPGTEYEDMVRVVVDRIQRLPGVRDTRSIVEVGFRLKWPCKK
jgi:hypothetical protein